MKLARIAALVTLVLCCLAGPALADAQKYIDDIAAAEQTGDFEKVFNACQAALKSGELDWAQKLYAYQNRGMAYFLQHKYDESLQDFGTIIKARERVIAYYTHNPEDSMYQVLRMMLPAAYMMTSIIYEQQKKYELALNNLEEYFRTSGVDPDEKDLARRRDLQKKAGKL